MSGFGANAIKSGFNVIENKWKEYDEKFDSDLRYAHAIVKPQESCQRGINLPSVLCAKVFIPNGGGPCSVSYLMG